MAEATEELVKVYLEQKGYLVTTSKRIDVKRKDNAPRTEVDIVAVKTKGEENNLPIRLVGEVKSYGLNLSHMEGLNDFWKKKGFKSPTDYGRFKWLNDKDYRKRILAALNNEYGGEFQFVLFCHDIAKKYKEEISNYLNKENILVITHKEILTELFDKRKNNPNEYTDNEILQLIRLINKNVKEINF